MKYFQHVEDIGDLKAAVNEALEVKANRFAYKHLGENKTLMMIFFNSSLRTRLSTPKPAMNLGMNVIFVPRYGYMACAWAGFAGYGTSMLLSYVAGQHYYPIAYPIRAIAGYVLLAVALFAAMTMVDLGNTWINIAYRTVLLVLFAAVIVRVEHLGKALKRLPGVRRFVR